MRNYFLAGSCALLLLLVASCAEVSHEDFDTLVSEKSFDEFESGSESFYPLAVGNYWKINDQNWSEVVEQTLIEDTIYFKVRYLIGGDAYGTEWLRIDEDGNLISRHPDHPEWYFIKAKFAAEVGDQFFTMGDGSVNDYQVTVITKTDKLMEFSYDMVYHSNLSGHPYTADFRKGLGPVDRWNEVKIDGVVYTFN